MEARNARSAGNAQSSAWIGALFSDGKIGFFNRLHDSARLFVIDFAGLREAQLTRRPLQKFDAEQIFQVADATRNRWRQPLRQADREQLIESDLLCLVETIGRSVCVKMSLNFDTLMKGL